MKSDRGAALALISAAVLGLFIANSPFGPGLLAFLNFEIGPAAFGLNLSVSHWIKDLLLAIFFLVAGLELKYELRLGVLSKPATALVPVLAALGGVIIPALIYVGINFNQSTVVGWPIPTATDIAFALGVLAIFGRGMPKAARIFLLALAIFDDLIAILIIALFFTKDLQPQWLLVALVTLAAFIWSERLKKTPRGVIRVLVFTLLWYAVLQSGVHPTIAGVLMGLAIPASRTQSLLAKIQPFTNTFVLPIFAFSAVAIVLPEFQSVSNVFLGIAIALPLGKTLGIATFAILANRIAKKESRLKLSILDFIALGAIAGVGFTVSLLMAQLAFIDQPQLLAEATIAVVIGSLVSMAIGALIVGRRGKHYLKISRAD